MTPDERELLLLVAKLLESAQPTTFERSVLCYEQIAADRERLRVLRLRVVVGE